MTIKQYIKDNLIHIKVSPNSKTTKLIIENNNPKLYIKEFPDKDKANKAVIKFFKKEYSLNVEIVKGSRGRDKVLKIK